MKIKKSAKKFVITKILILLILAQIFPNQSFAKKLDISDPLFATKEIPQNHYDFYQDEAGFINKSCDFFDQKKLTIFSAINLGLCNNPASKSSWLAIKKQAAIYGIAKSAYLPTGSFRASKSKNTSKTDISNKQTNNISNTQTISINWLLYDFGARGAVANRDYFALIQSAQNHNRDLQQLIYQIMIAYYNLFSANEALIAAKIIEESNKTAYDVSVKKFKIGLVPKADVLKIESNYSSATLEKQKAQNNVANYLASFLQLLNLPQTTEVNLQEPSLNKDFNLTSQQDLKNLIDQALQNRPDLKAIIAKEKSLKADIRANNLDRLPKFSFYGDKSYSQIRNGKIGNSPIGNILNQKNDEIGLKMTFDFFTGFNQTYLSQQSQYNYQLTVEERKKIENQIAFDVWTASQNLQTAIETQATTQKLLKSATASKDIAVGMYKVGKGSALDIITSQASYASAMKEAILAKYNKFISQTSLLLAVGNLQNFISKEQAQAQNQLPNQLPTQANQEFK